MTGGRAELSRREFAAFGWIPFLQPRHISLAGARFRILRNGRSKRRYLRIHGNEETARLVLERHMELFDGIAYIIRSQVRNVEVDSLKIDPNRMFSRVGAEASLKNLNHGAAPKQIERALHTLDEGRERLVRALTPPRGGLLIALHNNSESYSVNNEVAISDQTSLRQPSQPHAFFLCTDPADFEVLKASPYNVVLQQHVPEHDDGSFSRLAAARGIRYVNLEVHQGEQERQREMLDWAEWNLR
jgi:hypothetical protein